LTNKQQAAGSIMEFQRQTADAAAITETRLQHWLARPAKFGQSAKTQAQPETPTRLADAMRHAVLGGGKRFRPFLVLESARLFDVDPDVALDIAAALECMHCYSLVHDDLPAMDNDTVRRGKPTVWMAYDEYTAILAGDALLTLAFEIIAHPTQRLAPRIQIELIHALARASGRAGMVGGQQMDLDAEKRTTKKPATTKQVKTMQAMKTGALIRFACISGSILADRPPTDDQALATFGEHLGLAFQISDDLLDAEGDARIVGKAVAKDAAANKATLIKHTGIKATRAELGQTIDAALKALAPYNRKADGLRNAARFMSNRQS
jgi:farnesyl diphosphate synthase